MNESSPMSVMPAPEPSQSLVFLVDDEDGVLSFFSRLLGKAGYPVEAFKDPREALRALPGREVAVLLTDKNMPGMDGIELAKRCLGADPDLAVIILTGHADVDSAAESVRLGIEDYLLKPVEARALESSVQRAVWRRASRIYSRAMETWYRAEVDARAEEIARQKTELEKVSVGALSSLTMVLEAKNPHFKGHSEAVSTLGQRVAVCLGLSEGEVRSVRTAGYLHDIGMVAVSDSIIDKEGPLTDEEYGALKEHCRIGWEILRPFSHLSKVAEMVLHHHERFDGTGYPEGLAGDQIPTGAQILGIAEAFIALTERRSFRQPLSTAEALETLRGSEGVWFSSRILRGLEEALKE